MEETKTNVACKRMQYCIEAATQEEIKEATWRTKEIPNVFPFWETLIQTRGMLRDLRKA